MQFEIAQILLLDKLYHDPVYVFQQAFFVRFYFRINWGATWMLLPIELNAILIMLKMQMALRLTSDLILIQSDVAYTISPTPEMIPPIRFSLQYLRPVQKEKETGSDDFQVKSGFL